MRILLAEDDEAISGLVAKQLASAGYLAETATQGPEIWELGGTGEYAAIILDLGLPGMDGLSILKRWRAAGVETPVLVLTARGSWMERVDGFDAGADDYLPKPFRTEELMARVRALLRRAQSRSSPALAAGRFQLDERSARVSFDGNPVEVSPMEYRLLAYLAANKGRNITAIELANHVQGRDDDAAKNAVEAMVTRIRRKTATEAIHNRRGFGYAISDETL
ncbi:DNA-binding response OmpR family regulator [Pararhizobium capsulatum DSM 1112]|uniref:DNA-binding response OmpR family regulator n=1 Tax=Pararhizobium capsulatum DSM 1112 TaxID=1121113 RepID=A0ABU0BNJ2_9HYPH|nr:response regulator transcription factor [Pararhizobium capsulatum]MDQ0319826.1 DNA-binding response OmpR family regulator [Pararhizobium capsulatum DSM 1112]